MNCQLQFCTRLLSVAKFAMHNAETFVLQFLFTFENLFLVFIILCVVIQ